MKKLTLNEIATLSGVSRSTVSRVINNQADVSPKVRAHVLKIIAETGFHPNPAARSLAGGKTHVVGLVIPEATQTVFADPFFSRLIQATAEACNQSNYLLSLMLFHTADEEARLPSLLSRTRLFDGLIVTATRTNDPLVPHLLEQHLPFVMVGQHDDRRVSFVDADNRTGAYLATHHLTQLGYQRIATITGPLNNLAATQRRQGYEDALRNHGRAPDERLIVAGNYTQVSGYDAMRALLPHSPDAVFVASDTMALGALEAIHAAGLSVPSDLAVVGYDDLPPAMLADPPLTTVRQSIARLGLQAVKTLTDLIENGVEPARRVVIATELVVRSSCGAALPVASTTFERSRPALSHTESLSQ